MVDVRDVDFTTTPQRQPIDLLYKWFPRVAIALVFGMIGRSKFLERSVYVEIFDQIGFGVWFRYFTGTLQIGGALLVLIPRTFELGLGMIACTLVGAMLAWIFFLGQPGTAVIPGGLLAALIGVHLSARAQR